MAIVRSVVAMGRLMKTSDTFTTCPFPAVRP
jgi:hypothetical protein